VKTHIHSSTEHKLAEDSAYERGCGTIGKLDCFIRFDDVNYWHSRTRDLIADAGSYSYPAFRESFRELRRKARKSEFELVLALFKFDRAMRGNAPDADKD